MFAAAVCELAQAWDVGPDFVTHLPILLDGSVSGLQHIAAMVRDEVVGEYVNLTPSENGDDFYLRVAQDVWSEHCPPIMQGPTDRKPIKAAGCPRFYGSKAGGFDKRGKPHGMTRAVCEFLDEAAAEEGCVASHDGAELLAKAVDDSVNKLAPCVKEVRIFLEKMVRLYARHNTEFRTVTPLGWPTLHGYFKPDVEQVSVWVNGRKRHCSRTVGDKPEPRTKKAAQSSSPNFVHSIDACHLHMVLLAALAEYIELLTIHDCFGALATRVGRLKQIVNEEFKKLHEYDLLGDILRRAHRELPADADFPDLPKRGGLVINPNFHAFK